MGWRIPFCQSSKRDLQKGWNEEESEKKQVADTPRSSWKLKVFTSNGASQRDALRCMADSVKAASPRTPLKQRLKDSFRVGRKCGVCLEAATRELGMAVYTAECNHVFHFPCITGHVAKQGKMVCPVCRSLWKAIPLLAAHVSTPPEPSPRLVACYDDDEPLSSPCVPIPEVDEDVHDAVFMQSKDKRSVRVRIVPSAVAVSASTLGYQTYVVSVRVRAPPAVLGDAKKMTMHHRAAMDLVAVLDVSRIMDQGLKLQTLKRAMRLVISSLASTDRLCIIIFSSFSKRLLPLIRMTPRGLRIARLVVDRLNICGDEPNASNALKKATKVLQDRRERNPVASVMLLSNGGGSSIRRTHSWSGSSTRFSCFEIPVDAFLVGNASDSLTRYVGGVLRVVARDLRVQIGLASESTPAQIMAIYSCTDGVPVYHGSGSSRLGDLFAEEERELLVEMQILSSSSFLPVMSMRFLYKDPATNQVVYERDQNIALQLVRPSSSKPVELEHERLTNIFLSTRAIAEARRLVDQPDYARAAKLLLSTKDLLLRRGADGVGEYVCHLEHELSTLVRSRQHGKSLTEVTKGYQRRHEAKEDPLTPSAWSSANSLAMMRNSLKRGSDLHGFEDARF